MSRFFDTIRGTGWHPGQRLIFALPTLLFACVFLVPAFGDEYFLPGTSKLSLAHIMQVEYLVIASGLFLIMPAVIQPKSKPGKIIRTIVFVGLAYIFAAAAYAMNGLVGLFSYVVLVYVSYGGNTLLLSKQKVLHGVGMLSPVRWVINLPTFFSLLVYFDLGRGDIAGWVGKDAVVPFGASFFVILFLLESTLYYSLMVIFRNWEADQADREKIINRRIAYYSLFKK